MIAAAYAGFAGGLLGVLQAFMPPDAFTFEMSGELVMQTAIGGIGTLFGPLLGAAVWLFLQDFLQSALGLGAAWKLALGTVFVLLVTFLRRGIIGGLQDLYKLLTSRRKPAEPIEAASLADFNPGHGVGPAEMAPHKRAGDRSSGPILQASGLNKRYGGLRANSDIDFTVNHGELRGVMVRTAPES